MVLTDGWKKDVCALVREADVANIAVIDSSVDRYYSHHCDEICESIEAWAKDCELSYEDILPLCVDVLGGFHPSYKQLADLAVSICSRLGIVC